VARSSETPTAQSSLAFDDSLKARNAGWGVQRFDAVTASAERERLASVERIAMPANSLMVFSGSVEHT
jgi:hypothetical protein